MSVTRNTVIWAALVGAEGSDELTGTEVIAVVASCEEKAVVPGEGRERLVPVLDGLDGFEHSGGSGPGLQFGKEITGIHTDLVLELEDVANYLTVEATNHRDLGWAGHHLGLGVLGELSESVFVESEVVGRVDDGSHHGAACVSAGGNASVVPARIEEQSARSAAGDTVVDQELHGDLEAALSAAVGEVLTEGGASITVEGNARGGGLSLGADRANMSVRTGVGAVVSGGEGEAGAPLELVKHGARAESEVGDGVLNGGGAFDCLGGWLSIGGNVSISLKERNSFFKLRNERGWELPQFVLLGEDFGVKCGGKLHLLIVFTFCNKF